MTAEAARLEAARLKKIKDDEAKKIEVGKKKRAAQLPLLSQVFPNVEDISLNNNDVNKWAMNMITEISQLYRIAGKSIPINRLDPTSEKRVGEMDAAPPSPIEYMDVDTDIALTRKRPREDRCEICTQDADLLAPRYTGQSNQYVEIIDWISTNTGEFKRSQRVEDEKDTRAMIISIHRGNPVRAAT